MPGARKTVAPSAEVSSTVVSGLGSASCSELLEADSAVSVAARVRRGGTCASAGRPAARTVRLREVGALTAVLTVPPSPEPAGEVTGAEGAEKTSSGSGGGPAARRAPLVGAGVVTRTSLSPVGGDAASWSVVSVVPAVPSAPFVGSLSSIRAVSRQSLRAPHDLSVAVQPHGNCRRCIGAGDTLVPPGQSPVVAPTFPAQGPLIRVAPSWTPTAAMRFRAARWRQDPWNRCSLCERRVGPR